MGSWGRDCNNVCTCRDVDTMCDVTTGCTACLDGWTGGNCDEDIDECLEDICSLNSNCSNFNGTFLCVCHPGYEPYNETYCAGEV